MDKGKRTVFEWGGKRFSDQEGLGEILSGGYFREGNAWGSVRSGWEVALAWTEVRPLLMGASGAGMVEAQVAGMGRERMSSVPEPLRRGDLRGDGQRLWMSTRPAGWLAAAAPMWARCEAWQIGQSARRAPGGRGTAGKKGQALAAGSARTGPRRL